MELTSALDFVRPRHNAVLTTIRTDTRPQQSNVTYRLGDDGLVRVSITAERAKYKNLLKRPWAVLHVSSEDFWSYVVVEGDVTLSDVAQDPHDATVEELIEYYRSINGEHPDWDDYRAAMVKDQRVVLRLQPTRAYGMVR